MRQKLVTTDLGRRALIFTGAAAAALPFTIASSQSSAQSQIVDRSGSLRMLSQRMSKAYCQLGLSVLANEAETILARSLTRFNGAMVSLRENGASDQALIRKIEADWVPFRDLVSTTPSKGNGVRVDALSEAILVNAEALTTQLATALRIQSARLTNVSGRQRMLSQRMAKSAFALMWGMDVRGFTKQFDSSREQFIAALAELKRSPQKTPQIDRSIEMAEIQFGFFDNALGNRAELTKLNQARAANVAKSNERLLEIFDELTMQFAGLTT